MRSLVLREWLRRNELPALPESRINEFLQQLVGAESGRHAEVRWSGWTIRRYRDDLWLHPCLPELACRSTQWHNAGRVNLGAASGTLSLTDRNIEPPSGWAVGPRRGGARFRSTADAPSRSLKFCFQACGVPPWLREGVPVLYWDDEPVAIGDGIVAERLRRGTARPDRRQRLHHCHAMLTEATAERAGVRRPRRRSPASCTS